MKKGWISVHRQIWDNEYLWDDKPFTRGQAWIDLLLLVNHEEKNVLIDKKMVSVERGQAITSLRKLGDRWGWSRTKVSDFLNSLLTLQMAKIESDTKKTVVTIEKYSFFQDSANEKRQRNDSEMTPKSTNNKIITKQDNKEIKDTAQKPADKPPVGGSRENLFESFWKAYPKKRSKGDAEKAWKAIKPNEELLKVMLSKIEEAKLSHAWQKENGQYIPHPATWLRAKGWEDEHGGSAPVLATPCKPKKYKTVIIDGNEVDVEVTEDEPRN